MRQNFEVGDQEEDLQFQGVEIDDNHEPAVKNAGPPSTIDLSGGRWIKPAICPRRALNVSDSPGSWSNNTWSQIADMDELALF